MKIFRRFLLIMLAFFSLSQSAFSEELSSSVKEVLRKKFVNIVFKIDNSFTIKNKDTYLPLIPKTQEAVTKIEITGTIPDKSDNNLPKLVELSNGWIFV